MLLGHMGGPFWARKDTAAWSAPKGGVEPGERPEDAAEREFLEETGLMPPPGPRRPLGDQQQRSGKVVRLWAVEQDLALEGFAPGTFELEWPPRSGRWLQVPEIDRLEWTPLAVADVRLVAGQRPFLPRLERMLGEPPLTGGDR